jgi:signal transduction histidine kinase
MGKNTAEVEHCRPTTERNPRSARPACRAQGRRQAHVAASRARIVAAADSDRRQIERDLHDGAQQGLVSIACRVRSLGAALDPQADALRRELTAIAGEVDRVVDELRDLARGIHPAVLARRGLRAALLSLARRAPLPIEVSVRVPVRPDDAVELGVYFVVAEAVTNVVKHAQASFVTVDVVQRDRRLVVAVEDDGVGGADLRRGSGLIGLRDRVDALGGTLSVRSPGGRGTSIVVDLPVGCRSRVVEERGVRCG